MEIHPSHEMQIENGSAHGGEWYGTFWCKHCKRREYRPRTGQRLPSPELYEPCAGTRGEIVNPHVLEHVEEPNRFLFSEGHRE